MSYSVQTLTLAQSASVSGAVDLTAFELVGIDVPVLTSCDLYLQVAPAVDRSQTAPLSASYKRLWAALGGGALTINAALGSLSFSPGALLGGFQYARVETGVAQAAARTFTVALKKYSR